jgi:hypothetical protein
MHIFGLHVLPSYKLRIQTKVEIRLAMKSGKGRRGGGKVCKSIFLGRGDDDKKLEVAEVSRECGANAGLNVVWLRWRSVIVD